MPSPPPQALHYSNTDPPPFPKHINTSHRKLQNNFIKQSLPNNSSLKNTFNNRKPFANLNSNHLQLQPSFTKPYRKPNPQPQPQPRLGPKSPVFSSPAGRCRRAAAARCSASWPPSEAQIGTSAGSSGGVTWAGLVLFLKRGGNFLLGNCIYRAIFGLFLKILAHIKLYNY